MKFVIPFLVLLLLVIIGGAGFFGYTEFKNYEAQNKQTLLEKNSSIIALRNDRDEQDQEIVLLQTQVQELQERLGDEVDKFEKLEDRVKDSLETVDTLKKLSERDLELLQKYSKIYFLNEHYEPRDLTDIDEEYLLGNKTLQIKSEVKPFLDTLLEKAADDGIDLQILSAYRSFGTQAVIKQSYITTYGTTAANTFSADQGYSEHQLGTTLDFTTPELGSNLSDFKMSDAYEWLQDNGYKYGFVLSYPEDNSFYVEEPWHWRFVGEDLAKDLRRDDKGFYDLPQRELNTYIINIFED